jgi:hypothetical protein
MKPVCKSYIQGNEHVAGSILPLKNKLCIYEKNIQSQFSGYLLLYSAIILRNR